ncbi:MAG: DUF4870 domain-containing protein [Verrucomicrobiota bacterium]|nr:DUF4870 domain-containing protein [Verrucomicrobiota bacterium]
MSEENTSPELTPDPPEIPETPPTPTDDPYANLPSDPAKQEKDWAMITHLSGLCSAIGIPSFVGPLVCWLLKKDEFAKVDLAGKEALNFQLSVLIVQVISVPLTLLVGIGFVTFFAAAISGLVYTIIAAVAASNGEDYLYPLTFRMIK